MTPVLSFRINNIIQFQIHQRYWDRRSSPWSLPNLPFVSGVGFQSRIRLPSPGLTRGTSLSVFPGLASQVRWPSGWGFSPPVKCSLYLMNGFGVWCNVPSPMTEACGHSVSDDGQDSSFSDSVHHLLGLLFPLHPPGESNSF